MVVGPPFTGRHVPHVRERLDPRKIVGFLVVLFQRSLPTTAQPRAARRRFCIFRLGGTFTARDLVPRRWLSLSRSSTVGRRSQPPSSFHSLTSTAISRRIANRRKDDSVLSWPSFSGGAMKHDVACILTSASGPGCVKSRALAKCRESRPGRSDNAQAKCAVARKRKFPEHYGSSKPQTPNRNFKPFRLAEAYD